MDALAANRPRHNLHRASFGGAPCAHGDAAHAAASGGEQRRVPAEQPFGGQGLRIVLRGIEHHFDNALDVAIRLNQRSEEHTSELQSLMRISYAVFCLKKKKPHNLKRTDNALK